MEDFVLLFVGLPVPTSPSSDHYPNQRYRHCRLHWSRRAL